MRCIGETFIIEPDEWKKKTDAGIIIIPGTQMGPISGEVKAVGNGPIVGILKVGDRLQISPRGATEVDIGSRKYIHCQWPALVCIFESPEEEERATIEPESKIANVKSRILAPQKMN